MSELPLPPAYYVEKMRALHVAMRDHLLKHLNAQEDAMEEEAIALAGVADVRGGDTIYTIDEHGEAILFAFCEDWAKEAPFVLISEGIEDAGWRVFPAGAKEEDATFLMIVDPIDGTRNIMYNKRAAWILSGIAPNKGAATTLADIEAAVMTEVPTTRHLYSDQLWATPGGGAHREAENLITRERKRLPLRPSRADNLAHGFASVAKFFPPAKEAIAGFEEKLLARVAPDEGENPLVFDDEYISTGGQLYEILVGHDRFIADLRPVFFEALGLPKKLVCHPYDICTELIAREAGVVVTDAYGSPLSAPLDIRADIAWTGYANAALQARIQPHLIELLADVRQQGAKGE
jgi:fructose-1,6-bisphosphatase/inositol monophosphatase family enzyme